MLTVPLGCEGAVHPLVATAGAPKAIALPPSGGTPLASPHPSAAGAAGMLEGAPDMPLEEEEEEEDKGERSAAGALVPVQLAQGFCEADWPSPSQCMQPRQAPGLPALVMARPLTLPMAVAEAVTQAAYLQGSSDNLAVVAVDLMGAQRTATTAADAAASIDDQDSGRSPAGAPVQPLEPTGVGFFSLSVPRRSTSATTKGLHLEGAAQQYELKELLALVPRQAHLRWPASQPALSPPQPDVATQQVLQEGAGSAVQTCSHQAALVPGEGASSGATSAPVCRAPHAAEQLQLGPSASQMVQRIASVPLVQQAGGTPQDGGKGYGVLVIAQTLFSTWASALGALELGSGGGAGLEYTLDAQFAQGGFGEVWRAERKPGACQRHPLVSSKHSTSQYISGLSNGLAFTSMSL